jgi:molybdopterin-guanine dinucleotide biosynthesis protein A
MIRPQNTPVHSDTTLAILAGGSGKRLAGADKGLLLLEGRTILSRLLDLRSLFGDLLLVTSAPDAYFQYRLRSAADVIADRGAPGGVHSALVHARTQWVLAVGCDMPFVSAAAVERILEAREPKADVVCFEVSGRLEPLLAAYRVEIAPQWGRHLEKGPSFREIFKAFHVKTLPADALIEVDPEMRAIVSLNTPEDLARFHVQRSGPPKTVP